MKRLEKVWIHVNSTWRDKQDKSLVRVVKVAPNSVRYVLEDLPDLELGRYRRGFLEDFELVSTPPNTTGVLDA